MPGCGSGTPRGRRRAAWLIPVRRCARRGLAVVALAFPTWVGVATGALVSVAGVVAGALAQQGPLDAERIEGGRFTFLAYPQDEGLARALLSRALANDSFPGLPRPTSRVVIELAPDDARFRAWVGDGFPEWGAAAAFPLSQRIVMHGRRATGKAGDPIVVLRHELAHLALAEAMGGLVPRWFDEGYASYAAGEWGRDEILATSVALVWRGPTTFAALDSAFGGGTQAATAAYALAHRAIAEFVGLSGGRGLAPLFAEWRSSGSLDVAVRRAYGMTLPAFEERWHARVRRRYGAIAVVADLALVASLLGLIVVPAYLSRRRREKRRLETLRIREADQERRARESALDALLDAPGASRDVRLLDTPPDKL
jgi:hypothetical protein